MLLRQKYQGTLQWPAKSILSWFYQGKDALKSPIQPSMGIRLTLNDHDMPVVQGSSQHPKAPTPEGAKASHAAIPLDDPSLTLPHAMQ